jgi:hypothetical protein
VSAVVGSLAPCTATIETQVNVVLNVISLGVVLVMVWMLGRMRGITEGNAQFLAWWRNYYAIPAEDSTPTFKRWQKERQV